MSVPGLSGLLLSQAPNTRHGLTLRPVEAKLSKSDVGNIFHVGVPMNVTDQWKSASGGVGFDLEGAHMAAIGESIERYAATVHALPLRKRSGLKRGDYLDAESFSLFTKHQRSQSTFPFANIYTDECLYTNSYDFFTNKEMWLPHPLVALRDDFATGVPTSSGLAAGETPYKALLRAIQELIERDALMVTWLHSLPGRRIALPSNLQAEPDRLQAEVYAFDITPVYSPFPVVAVAGGIQKNGYWRNSLGVACRETVHDATQKAYLEWCQGVFFAGIYPDYVETKDLDAPSKASSFDDHAIYYTLHPEQWWNLPLFSQKRVVREPLLKGRKLDTLEALKIAYKCLKKTHIRIYYRSLTTIDSIQAGVYVMRAVSPDLAPIFAHQEWPFLGGTVKDVKKRYPFVKGSTSFPNLMPHPLG